MRLKKISLASFRNLRKVELEPGPRFNILYGNNGQGKTSLLEAIYLLGTLKSFRLAKNGELTTWGAPFALVRGTVEHEGVDREIALVVEREGKRVRVDQKAIARPADFFGSLNVVVFSPDEMAMAKGGPDVRRRYLDRAVFSGDAAYLTHFHDYSRVLKNRNALLKKEESSELEVWSEKLADTGARLIDRRMRFLLEIEGLLREFYRSIAGSGEEVGIGYRPHLLDRERLQAEGAALLREGLTRTAAEERRTGATAVGPHRDDVEFILNGRALKQYASQGQQRSFILALKMAEIEYLRRKFGFPPLLLLDDMTSELDRERNRNLMEFLKQKRMQVFITTTSLQNIGLDGIDNYRTFLVSGGEVSQQR
jgi:DNA replication and repair protein RecF